MSFRQLTAKGTATLEVLEGTIRYIYDDARYPTRMWKPSEKVGGTLTAGVGHVVTTAEIKRWAGKAIPLSQITAWLDADTDIAEQAVSNLVKVQLNDNQLDVLDMFTFNAGVKAFANSTLLKRVNANQLDLVPKELMKWTHTKIHGVSEVSPGLVARRAKEVAYWNDGSKPVKAAPAEALPATQVAVAAPHSTSPMEWITGGAALATPAAGFANSTGFVAIAFGAVLLIVAVVIGAIVIKRQFFTH